MIASAPLLRPAFDHTVDSVFNCVGAKGISPGNYESGNKPSGKSTAQTKSSTTTSVRLSIPKRCKSPAGIGFQQISESEENLRWELHVMRADKGKTLTEVSNSRGNRRPLHDETLPVGHIKVTHSTEVSRQ